MANRRGTSTGFWKSMEHVHNNAFGGADTGDIHVVPMNTPTLKATIAELTEAATTVGEKVRERVRRYVRPETTDRDDLFAGFEALNKEV